MNMTKAVSALSNLPAGVQAGAEAQAARKALYDYLKTEEGGKAAAYDKAAKVLKGSISSALETEWLDAGTRQTLERALDNIDSKGEMGDNISENLEVENVHTGGSEVVEKQQLANKIAKIIMQNIILSDVQKLKDMRILELQQMEA